MDELTVRRAENGDIERICELLLQVAEVHAKLRPDIFREGARKYSPEEVEKILADASRPVFVACRDGKVAGYAFCQIQEHRGETLLCDRKTLYLDDLCVDESCRRERIGERLFEAVRKYAKEIGCYDLTLNVWSANKNALRFYEKMGMKPQCEHKELIL